MVVFRKQDYLHIVFDDGQVYVNNKCDDQLWALVGELSNDEEALKARLVYTQEAVTLAGDIVRNKIENSNILTKRGNSVYMLEVSELSIPEDFALKVLEAEEKGDEAEINKFRNFWTLVSLNPDSRVRDNIFWFIRKWGMKISDSGLIIAYRNADIKWESTYSTAEVKEIINNYYTAKYIDNIDPNTISTKWGKSLACVYDEIINNGVGSPVYTDHHSHTTTIVLGRPVSIPRSSCDCDSTVSCSRGLHVGSKGWLKQNYFGNVGLQVLVNPANVVAVPVIDDYGKMRCCEYFPVALIDFDANGDIIEKPYSLHNDVTYLKSIRYDGTINNEDANHYELSVQYKNNEELYDSILERLNNQ